MRLRLPTKLTGHVNEKKIQNRHCYFCAWLVEPGVATAQLSTSAVKMNFGLLQLVSLAWMVSLVLRMSVAAMRLCKTAVWASRTCSVEHAMPTQTRSARVRSHT